MPGLAIAILKWLHCLILCSASAFEFLEAVNAFGVPAAMKGRPGCVDEICVFTGLLLNNFGVIEVDGKGLWDSRKPLEASIFSLKAWYFLVLAMPT